MTEGILLSLDPSSTATGWAVLEVKGSRLDLLDLGVIRPPSGWDVFRRTDAIVEGLGDVVSRFAFAEAATELTTGQTASWLRKEGVHAVNPQLAMAQGVIVRWLKNRLPSVATYGEKEWTKGRKKEDRVPEIVAEFPLYCRFLELGNDRGLDAADAIGVALHHVASANLARLMALGQGSKMPRNRGRR